MKIDENIIQELNFLLETESFDIKQFEAIIERLKTNKFFKITIIELKQNSESKLQEAINNKMKFIELKHFEMAAFYRDVQVKCTKNIELIGKYNVTNSKFEFDNNQLFYFHAKTSLNDEQIKQYLEKNTIAF